MFGILHTKKFKDTVPCRVFVVYTPTPTPTPQNNLLCKFFVRKEVYPVHLLAVKKTHNFYKCFIYSAFGVCYCSCFCPFQFFPLL